VLYVDVCMIGRVALDLRDGADWVPSEITARARFTNRPCGDYIGAVGM